MASQRATTIEGYIRAAPAAGQPHLHQLHQLLKQVAPGAQEAIKWNMPFFIEPRFLFAFSAHRSHLSFAPSEATLDAFRSETGAYSTTKGMLRIPYDTPFPAVLVRRIAKAQLQAVRARRDDGFW